jgi:predicted RNase H-like HicB family nuclease
MRYQVVLRPGESGWIVVECPSLPGCISQGKTREDALANIKEAMELWLEVEAEKTGNVPPPQITEIVEVDVQLAA